MENQKDWVPQREVVGENQGLLIILTGPTASGKDRIMERLLENDPKRQKVVTYTTRAPREGEKEGSAYCFIGRDKFEEMKGNGEFLETNEYDGNFYGTAKRDIEAVLGGQDIIWRIDTSRAGQVEECMRENFPRFKAEELLERTTVVFIGIPRLTVLKDRFLVRARSGDKKNREEFRNRLKKDWEDWKRWEKRFRNIVINEPGALDGTMRQVEDLIKKHREAIQQPKE